MNLQDQKITLDRKLLYERHRLSHQQIDDFLSEKESSNYIAEKLEQLVQLYEFLYVTDKFSSEGLSFISIKGPLLSNRLYNDATYRRYKDFDFFIELSTIEMAIDILKELGYKPTSFNWPTNRRRKQLIVDHGKHISFYHPDKSTCIELHWKLFDARITKPEIIEQLIFKNLTTTEFKGRRFKVFNTEFELLYLIIHGGLSNWFRLKWLVDIHQLLQEALIKKDKFIEITSLLKAGRMVALCNAMIAEFFPDDKKLPVEINQVPILKNFSLKRIYQTDNFGYNTMLESLESIWINLISFPGCRYKYDVISLHLFYTQQIDNEKIPPFSAAYYFLGINKRIFSRLRLLFKPPKLL